MNERIRQLAKQAGAEFYADTILVNGKDADDLMKRFAELIVLECLEVIEAEFGGGNGDGVEWDRAVEFTYDDVVKHFGVEQ